MLLEVSIAIRISRPFRFTSCHLKPHWGRISDKTHNDKAKIKMMALMICLLKFTDKEISRKVAPLANFRIAAFLFL